MAEVGKVCLLLTEEMFSFSDLYAPFFSRVFFFVAAVLFLVSFLLREFQTRWILELVLLNFLQLCNFAFCFFPLAAVVVLPGLCDSETSLCVHLLLLKHVGGWKELLKYATELNIIASMRIHTSAENFRFCLWYICAIFWWRRVRCGEFLVLYLIHLCNLLVEKSAMRAYADDYT
jgi:hypothetical protein